MKNKIIGFTTLLFLLTSMFLSCSFFSSFEEHTDDSISINALTLAKTSLSTQVGAMEYISLSVKPNTVQKDISLNWSYDKSIIECDTSSNWGVTIKGLAEGQTTLKCSYGGYDASCLVKVSGYTEDYEVITEPYIYSNYSILQTSPGVSEKVFVSLYGGDAADIDGYSWTIDNSSVATIQPTGQYCIITAKDSGYARIKITHSKATYPYYMGVYVFADATNVSYITTSNNIVTMNMDEGDTSISVSLVNKKDSSLDNQFKWEIINDEGSETPVALSANGNNAVISPKRSGSCTLRVTHPDAAYPLDILCRVITIVKNVYIQPDNTVITLSGTAEETVTSELMNIKAGDYSLDGYEYRLDNYNVAEIVSSVGNQVVLKGVANGSCKLIISHERSAYSREVLVIVNGQLKDAIDASCYITTSQNYIKTKVGAEAQTINISLKGGEDGDESSFMWSVKSSAADGSANKVINLETATGSVFHTARSAAATYSYGTGVIEPLCEGTAVITITHPKIVYPTEILVKVLSKDAVLEEPLYFVGPGLVKILNGDEEDYTVQLKGSSKANGDEQKIKWDWDESILTVSPAGDRANIAAPAKGTGCTTSNITISHQKTENNKTVLVMTADDIETLNSMKALYSDKLYYNLQIGDIASVIVNHAGFDSYDETTNTKTTYDFSPIQWTVKDSSIISIEKNSVNPLLCSIKALKSGQTTLTAKIEAYSCDFTILVYPEGRVSYEPEVYFTTAQNVISLSSPEKSTVASVSAVNLPSSEYQNIVWKTNNPAIATVVGNGTDATINAISEGEAVITVSHKDSQNSLEIYVRVGSEYVIEETKSVVYIKAEDLITIVKDKEDKRITATLINWTSPDSSGFTFTSKDSSIAKVSSQSSNGNAYIKGVSKGYTEIEITHKATKVSKSVLVIVGETQAEVNTIIKESIYMSTSNNTVTFNAIGKSSNVSVKTFNLNSAKFSGIEWTSADESIAQVHGNGTSATIYSQGKGVTTITASYPDSINSITFYIFVNTEDIVVSTAGVVYISATDVLTFMKDGTTQTLQAVLVNSTEANPSGFSFEIDNEAIAKITAQTDTGIAYVKPISSGQAQITITNTATEISKQVLVVVGNSEEELAGFTYLTTSSNVVSIGEGSTKTVSVSVKNADSPIVDGYSWSTSNPSVVDISASGSYAILKANSIGTALITVTNKSCKYSLTIIAQVIDPIAASANPYIQLSSSVLTLTVSPGYSSLSADLVGGTTEDYQNFVWEVKDTSICAVYGQNEVGKLRALKAGQTYVTVSHPKATYPAQLLVVCEDAPKTDCYISVPSSIITMKPNAAAQTVTASLVNGSSTDKYNFSWSLDVYDVVDIQYSANVCTITPKQTGTATITLSHPKAAYSQQIIVNVQEYSNFAFPQTSANLTQGTVSFMNMQVPTTSVTTHVEYSVDNSKICSITGTKSVAQITGVQAGTTTVRAKLIASSTGVTQAESEMLVYVQEAPTNAVYITSSSTIYTVNKGKSQTLSATLSGNDVTSSDQYNLKWTTSDSDIVQVTGISSDGTVTGQSIYITALKPGEALITCSHEKAASTLQFYVVVPGTGQKSVVLNKSYITMTKGSSGTQLKATIENADGTSDYNSLVWNCEGANGIEVARIMGNGQNITVYPLNVGEATITCQHPDCEIASKCTVVVEAGKSLVFETNSRKVQPFHTKTLKYKVSPPTALLTWTMAQDDDYFEYRDLGCDAEGNGEIEITGMKVGNGTLACVTDGNAKAQCTVKVAWDYEFAIVGSTTFTCTPIETKTYEYSVSPVDAQICIESTELDSIFTYETKDNGNGTGVITIKPITESPNPVYIKVIAKNPKKDYEEIGSKTITAKFAYPALTLHSSFVSRDGNFSSFNESSNTLTIGDGENVQLKFQIKEKQSQSFISKVQYTKSNGSTVDLTYGLVKEEKDQNFAIYNFEHPTDKTIMQYRIEKAYVPTWLPYGAATGTGAVIEINDWQTSIVWRAESDNVSGDCTDDYFGLTSTTYSSFSRDNSNSYFSCDQVKWLKMWTDGDYNNTTGSYYGKKEDTSLRGKIYSEDEFRKIGWFYCPGTEADGKCDRFIYYPVANPGGHGRNSLVYLEPHVMTENVTAIYETTTDKTIVSSGQIGYITVIISHLGKDGAQKFTIPVYCEERNCAKNCQ